MSWLYLVLAITCECVGTMSLRQSNGFQKKTWIVPVTIFFAATFVFLFLSLGEGMAIGVAYGIWASVGVALTAIVARLLFKDRLTGTMGVGIAIIAGGVLLIELGATH